MNYKDYQLARSNNLPTAKIGNIELYDQEIKEYLLKGCKYIVTYKKVYQIKQFNCKPGFVPFHGLLVFNSLDPLTRRGRYYAMTAKQVNNLIGIELLGE